MCRGVLRAPLHESAEFRPTSVPAQRVFSPGVLHPTATAHAADVANGVADDGLTPGGGGHAGDDGVAGNLLSRAASVAVAAMAATAASNEDTDEVEEQERLARTTERLVLVDAQSKPESLDSFEGRLATSSTNSERSRCSVPLCHSGAQEAGRRMQAANVPA